MTKTKPKTVKKLRCPAYVTESKQVAKNGHMELVKKDGLFICKSIFEYNEDVLDAELKATRDLIIHIRDSHNFYWKRHGKQLVMRHNKKVAMRG